MRKIVATTLLALSVVLGLSLGACGKKDEATTDQQEETIIVEDTAAPDDDEDDLDDLDDADELDEDEDDLDDVDVIPITRAQGPLAIAADDDLCSIVVTGTGSNESGYGYGIEVSNYGDRTITVTAVPDSFTADGAAVAAEMSLTVEPQDDEDGTLVFAYTDALPDADAFAQAAVTGTLQVTPQGIPDEVMATYTLTIE